MSTGVARRSQGVAGALLSFVTAFAVSTCVTGGKDGGEGDARLVAAEVRVKDEFPERKFVGAWGSGKGRGEALANAKAEIAHRVRSELSSKLSQRRMVTENGSE